MVFGTRLNGQTKSDKPALDGGKASGKLVDTESENRSTNPPQPQGHIRSWNRIAARNTSLSLVLAKDPLPLSGGRRVCSSSKLPGSTSGLVGLGLSFPSPSSPELAHSPTSPPLQPLALTTLSSPSSTRGTHKRKASQGPDEIDAFFAAAADASTDVDSDGDVFAALAGALDDEELGAIVHRSGAHARMDRWVRRGRGVKRRRRDEENVPEAPTREPRRSGSGTCARLAGGSGTSARTAGGSATSGRSLGLTGKRRSVRAKKAATPRSQYPV